MYMHASVAYLLRISLCLSSFCFLAFRLVWFGFGSFLFVERSHQYQDLQDPATRKYNTKSECSIFFEVDGPYR